MDQRTDEAQVMHRNATAVPAGHTVQEVRAIQGGDEALRNRFIEDHIPMIRREVRRVTRSYFVEQEEEFAIALEAFNGAIDRYRSDRGVPFEPFARLLIRNRLLDRIRRRKFDVPTRSLSEQDSEDGLTLGERLADPRSDTIQEDLEFEESMIGLEYQLHRFGATLPDLVARFPKHRDSRLLCIRLAREIAGDDVLYGKLLSDLRVPGAELSRRLDIPLKTIERNRGSLILLSLLLRSDLRLIHSYVTVFEREEFA